MTVGLGLTTQQVPLVLAASFLAEPPGWTRLEPQSASGDPAPGLEARVHDPLWMLARQWQLGEFQGEDVGSPVTVSVDCTIAPVVAFQPGAPADGRPVRPWSDSELIEPVIEREPSPARGLGLRQRAEAGAQLFADLRDVGVGRQVFDLILADCPLALPWSDEFDRVAPPLLTLLEGRLPDGHSAAAIIGPGLQQSPPTLPDWFEEVPNRPQVVRAVRRWYSWYRAVTPEPGDADPSWIDARLEYQFSVGVEGPDGPRVLHAPSFSGGRADWYSLDEDADAAPLEPAEGPPESPVSRSATLLATPLRFSGMPAGRYWEFEDGQVNLGALRVQPHDLARLALVEFAMVYGSDWLVVPVDVPSGSFVSIDNVRYTTTFGEEVTVPAVDDGARSGTFRLFEISQKGTDASRNGLLVLSSAPAVLEGEVSEEVLFLRDEMANLAWAVERVVEGPSGDPRNRGAEPRPEPFQPSDDPSADMTYQLANEVPDRWIPLLPVSTGYATIALQKGAMIKGGQPIQPLGVVLRPGEPLVIQDEEVPRDGVRVRRRSVVARDMKGRYVRWLARRVDVGRGEGSSGLAFDTAVRRQPVPDDL